ncbi:alpha-tocopherol transfer protein-like isoform X2 [Euwallacea similis]
MSKLSKLLQVTEEEKDAILKHYSITEEQFDDNVRILKEWIKQSEHLPDDDNDNKLKIILLNCKMSLEKSKQCLEGYYRIRSRYHSEFFDKLVPSAKEYQESKRFVKTAIMPKLTPDLCRITIFKATDPEGEANDAYVYELPVFMMAEMRVTEEMCLSNIIIVDFEGYSWKNLMKYTPTVNQKLTDMLIAVNLRIKSIHFINTNNIIEHVMRLIKALLPSKLVNKIHIHKTAESLSTHIPLECLPSNYGGTGEAIEDLYDEWCQQIDDSQDLFEKLLLIKSSEKIELDPYQRDMFGCGVDGSFKKLALD